MIISTAAIIAATTAAVNAALFATRRNQQTQDSLKPCSDNNNPNKQKAKELDDEMEDDND